MNIQTVTGETLAEFNQAKMADPFAAAEKEAEKAEEKAKSIKAAEAKEESAEEAEEVEAEPEVKEEKPKKGKLAERFSELTGKARLAAERAEAAEAKAAALAAELEALKKPAEKKADPEDTKPKLSDYTDYADYAEALSDWKVEQAFKARDAAEAKAKEEAARGEVLKAWQTRLDAAKAENPDFEALVASSDLAVNDVVRDTIIESEFGPELLLHFAENDDDAQKLNGMSVKQQLMYLAKLEVKFEKQSVKDDTAEEEDKPAKIEKPKVKLPTPITPIKAKSSAVDPINSPGEFTGSYAQYKAARQKSLQ